MQGVLPVDPQAFCGTITKYFDPSMITPDSSLPVKIAVYDDLDWFNLLETVPVTIVDVSAHPNDRGFDTVLITADELDFITTGGTLSVPERGENDASYTGYPMLYYANLTDLERNMDIAVTLSPAVLASGFRLSCFNLITPVSRTV